MMQWNQSKGHTTVAVARKVPLTSMLSRTRRRDGALSPTHEYFTRLWLDLFAREMFRVSSKIRRRSYREVPDNRLDITF